MKNGKKNTNAKETPQPAAGEIKVRVKEISFDENSPALLKKKKEAQALLQSNKAQAHQFK